jgi:hypothetical protein
LSSVLPLGAPGIYEVPVPPVRALTGEPMDVAAFVGVAPRGPAREPVVDERWPADRPGTEPGRPRARSVPVPVESWDEYVRLYGSFEGLGLLPYAVAAFFENGGRRAYVVRIVHDYGGAGDGLGAATGDLAPLAGGAITLRARNEGAWGNDLAAELTFAATPLFSQRAAPDELTFARDVRLEPGALLRLGLPGGTRALRFVARARLVRGELVATLDAATAAAPVAVELVEGTLAVDDGEGRTEVHERLGLSPEHRRYLGTVLSWDSRLLLPDAAWATERLLPAGTTLPAAVTARFSGGESREPEIVPDDLFDARWVLGDESSTDGVHALLDVEEVSWLVAPDLYSPGPPAVAEPIVSPASLAGPGFAPCVEMPPPEEQAEPAGELTGLARDPADPAQLAQIVALQQQLEELADLHREWIVLLDVPPRLSQRAVLAWRAEFSSAYAACHHPWLRVARRDDRRDAIVRVPSSAYAAGIAARKERTLGLPFGPANELAVGAVDVDDRVSPERHDELHPASVNVFLRERDGVRLTAARTLSRDAEWRQQSVRRLVTMLERVVRRQLAWLAFEPNTPRLRREVEHTLRSLLRRLWLAQAFAGATEDEAFFVRCDERLNPPAVVEAGRLVAEIGVAPAEPLEFLVLHIAFDAEGGLVAEERRA